MHSIGFRSRFGSALVATMSLIGLSCSGSSAALYPVKGKILHKGQPLAGAMVTFHPKGKADLKTIPSTGLTKEDGTYTLTTGDKDGAPAGEYVVTIICSEVVGVKPGTISTSPPESRDKLGGAYSSKDTSQINVTVKAGENQLEPFDLK